MNWIRNFKPRMVMFKLYDYDETVCVEAVCARRVFYARHKIALADAGNDKVARKLLGELGR